jgi:hypothetical protein
MDDEIPKPEGSDSSDDDDVPWTDPAIELEYKAALGDFVVEFNRLDNLVSRLISNVFEELKRPDLAKQYLRRPFASKVDTLELLALTNIFRLNPMLLSAAKEISFMRNRLVHGHFDQIPFDASYLLVHPKSGREDYVEAAEIRQWAERAGKTWHDLRYVETLHWFRGPPSVAKEPA